MHGNVPPTHTLRPTVRLLLLFIDILEQTDNVQFALRTSKLRRRLQGLYAIIFSTKAAGYAMLKPVWENTSAQIAEGPDCPNQYFPIQDIQQFLNHHRLDLRLRNQMETIPFGALPFLRDIRDFKVDIIQATTVRPPS